MADDIRQTVKQHYARAAREAAAGQPACCDDACDPVVGLDRYREAELSGLPEQAVLAALGCGNPTALAELRPGEVVLDLGAGGGIDVLLSARRVGPNGRAYGLDMTDEMVALARENQRAAGVENVEFLKGEIEAIPLPDAAVDVVISNCVINLSADKDRVLRETYRVLKPGGRFAVSDIVARSPVPDGVREDRVLWSACVAGALSEAEYLAKLEAAGFVEAAVEPTRTFEVPGAGEFVSAFIRARKPDA